MDDMKTYYCRRIKKDVVAERIESLTGDVIVQCKYDDNNKKILVCILILHFIGIMYFLRDAWLN